MARAKLERDKWYRITWVDTCVEALGDPNEAEVYFRRHVFRFIKYKTKKWHGLACRYAIFAMTDEEDADDLSQVGSVAIPINMLKLATLVNIEEARVEADKSKEIVTDGRRVKRI